MWGILVALISGALMSLQGVFNTEVTKQSSIWAAGRLGPGHGGLLRVWSFISVRAAERSGACFP